MSEHTPSQRGPRPDPADTVGADEIPGDPPVPITVWRTARRPDDPARAIPGRLAYRLVAAYTRPGDAVVDLTHHHHTVAAECHRGGRTHHRAWFTGHASLIIAAATPRDPGRPDPDSAAAPVAAGDEGEPPSLGAWFGDDLTDSYLPSTSGPAMYADAGAGLPGATSLVVATWPLHEVRAAHESRLAGLLAAGTRLLRKTGGCLILVVGATAADPAAHAAAPADFGPLVAAARRAGFGYLQHIVAVAADTDGDRFTYYVTDEELLALAHTAGQHWSVAHLKVHADLLVFTPAGGGRV